MQVLLGVDDTDVLGHKPGTGRLARDLGAHLEHRRLARLVGVVRQQLLVDPRIPYTSHNSPACLILRYGQRRRGGFRLPVQFGGTLRAIARRAGHQDNVVVQRAR